MRRIVENIWLRRRFTVTAAYIYRSSYCEGRGRGEPASEERAQKRSGRSQPRNTNHTNPTILETMAVDLDPNFLLFTFVIGTVSWH